MYFKRLFFILEIISFTLICDINPGSNKSELSDYVLFRSSSKYFF